MLEIEGNTEMTILATNPIPQLVARFRKLKAQADSLKSQMDEVKEFLAPAVEATDGQKWIDDAGYARMITRKASVTFSNADVNRLAQTWSESTDPIMQACGKMLLDLRKEKAGYSYLQVK